MSPLIHEFPPATPQQQDQALTSTSAILVRCRDLVRSLDLPAEAVATAVTVYCHELQQIQAHHAYERGRRIALKIEKLEKLQLERDYSPAGKMRRAQAALTDDLGNSAMPWFNKTEAEIDAEIARLEALPSAV